MNYKERFGINRTILGSAPVKETEKGAVIGDQPITIYLDEPIVAEYTDKGYPDQYCDTPWRYFNKLNDTYGLNLSLVKAYGSEGEAGKVTEVAEKVGARVIGVRVAVERDAESVSKWLKNDPNHRAVLLHSVAYEPGKRIFDEFPNQTTFGDLNPIIQWNSNSHNASAIPNAASIGIIKPLNGSDVPWRYVVKGKYSIRNGSGLHVSVLVKRFGSERWWVQKTTTFANESWETDSPGAYFGIDPQVYSDEINYDYEIIAIITGDALEAGMVLDNLPANVIKSKIIVVKRR
jgi:hypothetical protein